MSDSLVCLPKEGKLVMKNSTHNLTLGLLRAAYNDYIAARVLLNKDYTLQGAILAQHEAWY
jgi:hypothetical protein